MSSNRSSATVLYGPYSRSLTVLSPSFQICEMKQQPKTQCHKTQHCNGIRAVFLAREPKRLSKVGTFVAAHRPHRSREVELEVLVTRPPSFKRSSIPVGTLQCFRALPPVLSFLSIKPCPGTAFHTQLKTSVICITGSTKARRRMRIQNRPTCARTVCAQPCFKNGCKKRRLKSELPNVTSTGTTSSPSVSGGQVGSWGAGVQAQRKPNSSQSRSDGLIG